MGPYSDFYRQTPTTFRPNRPGRPNRPPMNQPNRVIGGGFLGPFLLGGLTGGLVAPFFYGGGYNRPNYYYPNYYYPPYYRPY